MKRDKIIFWITTGIISLMMIFSAFNYLTSEAIKAAFVHLGFPSYFRIELAIAKIIGALVLLIPMIPKRIKEAAYTGFVIVFISAIVAHVSMGDGAAGFAMPFVFLIILAVSYLYYQKLASARSV